MKVKSVPSIGSNSQKTVGHVRSYATEGSRIPRKWLCAVPNCVADGLSAGLQGKSMKRSGKAGWRNSSMERGEIEWTVDGDWDSQGKRGRWFVRVWKRMSKWANSAGEGGIRLDGSVEMGKR